MAMGEIVLEADALTRHYPIARGPFRQPALLKALDGASFTLEKRRTLAVVGESGCGKSTLARLVTMIEEPHLLGSLRIDGTELAGAGGLMPSGVCVPRCRSCSRTPMARSIRARRWGRSWKSRCWSITAPDGPSAATWRKR